MTDVNAKTTEWTISEALQSLLYELVKERSGACIISFRDPTYSPTAGGFHPVEIMVGETGDIQYITDFAYVGQPPVEELVKEIDFDFASGAFQHLGHELPISAGRGLYRIWENNFCMFAKMGVFETEVTDV